MTIHSADCDVTFTDYAHISAGMPEPMWKFRTFGLSDNRAIWKKCHGAHQLNMRYSDMTKDVFKELRDMGFKTMHRRNGQYWLMFDQPLTIKQLEFLAASRDSQKGLRFGEGEYGQFISASASVFLEYASEAVSLSANNDGGQQ